MTENEFSAMVCLMYNIGQGQFANPTVLREINYREYRKAADAILLWKFVKGVANEHQLRRRNAERDLFLK